MAQHHITHTCGHERTVQIYGTDVRGQRQQQANRLAAQPCQNCRHASQTAAAASSAAAQGLPELTGSDKQIAWATAIRAQAIAELDVRRLEMGAVIARDPSQLAAADAIAAALDDLVAERRDARWWIDNRRAASAALMSEAKRIARDAM